MKWQPIETAPKDGTKILLIDSDGDVVSAEWVRFDWIALLGDHEAIKANGNNSLWTHWMLIPPTD